MPSPSSEAIFTAPLLSRFKNPRCYRCGKAFTEGDEYHKTSRNKFYHKECWKAMQIEIE